MDASSPRASLVAEIVTSYPPAPPILGVIDAKKGELCGASNTGAGVAAILHISGPWVPRGMVDF
jgi:hypothetical protein